MRETHSPERQVKVPMGQEGVSGRGVLGEGYTRATPARPPGATAPLVAAFLAVLHAVTGPRPGQGCQA